MIDKFVKSWNVIEMLYEKQSLLYGNRIIRRIIFSM